MKIFVKIKWKCLRWLVKRNRISFRKMMCRMHWLERLKSLRKHDEDDLQSLNYSKLRELFIKEFPNEYLHNPYMD